MPVVRMFRQRRGQQFAAHNGKLDPIQRSKLAMPLCRAVGRDTLDKTDALFRLPRAEMQWRVRYPILRSERFNLRTDQTGLPRRCRGGNSLFADRLGFLGLMGFVYRKRSVGVLLGGAR